MSAQTLQPILGTDKNNQCFSVYKSIDDPSKLEVYFGLALLEKVNNDGKSLLFKMLVGRLYNARVKVKTLEDTFGIARSTFRSWGAVLNSEDDEEIVRVLSSSGGQIKITSEVERFIRLEFQRVYPENCYSYSSAVRDKVKQVFNIELSGEAVRPLFKQEKEYLEKRNESSAPEPETTEDRPLVESGLTEVYSQDAAKRDFVALESKSSNKLYSDNVQDTSTQDEPTPPTIEQAASITDGLKAEQWQNISIPRAPSALKVGVAVCDSEKLSSSIMDNNRKYSLPFDNIKQGNKQFYHHAGLMLLLPSILQFRALTDHKLILQWLSTILLGALNIEQTASLDLSSLKDFLSQSIIKSPKHQRFCLKSICSLETIRSVLKANIEYCGASVHNIFYYDPHSMPYSGLKKILKGWCGSLGKVSKVNYHDFIHNFNGEPVWFDTFDNYQDLRDRFTGVLSDFAVAIGLLPSQITAIVDRGIYGKKRMEAIHKAGFGLVTWQKNYTDRIWDTRKEISRFTITRSRNYLRDTKHWSIEFYRDDVWNTVDGYHRIIVRVLAPGKKNAVLLAVLSNDKCTDKIAVFAMLNRWIQENDFAYLIRHFGINMITTYDSEQYSEIEDELIEKEVYSDAYIVLKKVITSIEGKIKTLLLRKETSSQPFSAKDKKNLEKLKEQLSERQQELNSVKDKEDKFTKLSQAGTERLKLEPKMLMDAIKISARNIFYSHVEPFRKHFNNYRYDHKIFRELTRSSGYISWENNVIKVELNMARNFEPKEQLLVQSFLDKINSQNKTTHILLAKY